MKQTIFAYHGVTKWLKKASLLVLISCKSYLPLRYPNHKIYTINLSLASKFVQPKYKKNVLLPYPKKLSTDKLNPSVLNMTKSQFLLQHVKNIDLIGTFYLL